MGRSTMAAAVALALTAGGCTLLAGVEDIEYGATTDAGASRPNGNASPDADARTPPSTDAGPGSGEPDAGSAERPSGPADAGNADADAGAVADDPNPEPDPGPGPVADEACAPADFAANDRRGPLALRVVTFPALPAEGAHYSPSCMRIKAGQAVTFAGSFALYPLAAMGAGANASPIAPTAGGATASFTFAQKGTYGFGSAGVATMRGAIEVK